MSLRYLYGMDFNFDKAYDILIWRINQDWPTDAERFLEFLNTGAVYIAGRLDKAG